MVEAAFIFPIVIAAVIVVLYIVIGLYQSLDLQTSIHLALRKDSGENSETVYRAEDTIEFKSAEEMLGLRKALSMKEERKYKINMIFNDEITKKETGRFYVIDEAEMLRIISF